MKSKQNVMLDFEASKYTMNIEIKGTGRALPSAILTNKQLEQYVETSDEWIKERTGITKRHLSTGETVASLSADASLKALSKASVRPEDIELIIVATCSPEMALPCVACQVQEKLGATKAVAFDLNAACSGFLFALNTAYSYFAAGIYKNALVIGAEVLSKIIDWSDRGTCILFGDGAGAVYVEADTKMENNYAFVQHANGAKGMVLTCGTKDLDNPLHHEEISKKYVSMDGKEIFSFAVRQVPACIEELLENCKVAKEDIDYFVLHQANMRIIEGISKRLKVDISKFPSNVANVGNMSSAAIPVLLDECLESGILKKGHKVVLSGFGAGLTYGASIITI